MARKSKDPKKPSQAFLKATGQSPSTSTSTSTSVPAPPPTKAASPPPAPSSKSKGKAKATDIDNDILRQEIEALGGDEEDWEMLKDVSSDEEEILVENLKRDKGKGKSSDGGVVDEKKLKNELSAFMKSLDFSAVAPPGDDTVDAAESSDDEDAEEEDDEEDEEEAEDEDMDAANTTAATAEAAEDEEEDEEDEEDEAEEAPVVEEKVVVKEDVIPGFVKKSGLAVTENAGIHNIPPTPFWYQIPLADLPDPSAPREPLAQFRLAALTSRANSLLAEMREKTSSNPKDTSYGSGNNRANGKGKGKDTSKTFSAPRATADEAFLKQILADGTHQDKLSALILIVRESPIHRINELERLRVMAGGSSLESGGAGGVKGGGGREERISAVKGLADWWVSGGGKEAGKLRYFADQPLLNHPSITDRHLLVYAFEDWLKKWFFSLLQVLEVYLHDTVTYVKIQALNIVFKLLGGNAEQEQNLLRLGVNKLGDTDKSVASKASHLLLVLLQSHPAMKAVVIRDVAALVLKPTSAPSAAPSKHVKFDQKKDATAGKDASKAAADHARYYGLITLNQMILTTKERDVAARLVEVYFEVFRELLGSGFGLEEEDAAPANAMEKITGKVHNWQGRKKGTKNSKKKDEKKEEGQVEQGESKLIAAVLTGVTRALPFARLEDEVFEKHAETLFKVTHTGTFNIAIRALSLIFQVSSQKEAVSDRFYRTLYESLLDHRLSESNKQVLYLNLLFKALRADTNLERVMAFVKRLLQVMMGHQPPFICGALYLLGELFSTTSGLSTLLTDAEDSGLEHFVDAPEEGEEKSDTVKVENGKTGSEYEGRKRDPIYANAKGSCLWELIPFTHHFHPSVSLQANQLLSLSLPLSGSSSIDQNTLVAFLDRFAYRNPKQNVAARGASIMQPAAVSASRVGEGGVSVTRSKGSRVAAESGYVNDEKFWGKKVEDVPADQLFFHKFFTIKHDRQKQIDSAKKRRTKKGESEFDETVNGDDDDDAEEAEAGEEEAEGGKVEDGDESEDSDPEEAEIWKAMQASMPQTQDDLALMEDSDDLEYSSDEDEKEAEDEEEKDVETESGDEEDMDGRMNDAEFASEDEDDGLRIDEEDSDDLLDFDDMPDIPLKSAFASSDDDEDEDEDSGVGKKRKRDGKDGKEKKKKRRLPTLASADDYRRMIDDAEDENL